MSLKLFYDLINCVLSKQAPMKQKRVRRPIQPGLFKEDIKTYIRERDTFYKIEILNYKRARNKTISMIRKSKIFFTIKLFRKIKILIIYGSILRTLMNKDHRLLYRRLPLLRKTIKH